MVEAIINKEILEYIDKYNLKFKYDIPPKLGEKWELKKIATYALVNFGKPVAELLREDGAWMRIPADLLNGKKPAYSKAELDKRIFDMWKAKQNTPLSIKEFKSIALYFFKLGNNYGLED